MPYPLLSAAASSGLADFWPVALPVALGFVAVYLLLPRPRGYPPLWGALAAGLALLLAGYLLLRSSRAPETVLFYCFSGIAVVAGGLLITQRNPARAALSFALVVLSTCGLFLLQAAPFLMAATIIIYAGAIVVTFLFVIMLAQQEGVSNADFRSREPLLSAVAGFVLLGALLYVLQATYGTRDLDQLLARLETAQDRLQELEQRAGTDSQRQTEAEAILKGLFNRDREDPRDNSGLLVDFQTWRDQKPDRAAWINPENAESAVSIQLNNLQNKRPLDFKELQKELTSVREGALKARNSLGSLQPSPEARLSELSGPAANRPFYKPGQDEPEAATPQEEERRNAALRRDAQGRPQLPAENAAYLGRSLFTDYLLAVELGGTLLLVATIGAIAIAGRRAEKTS